MLDSLQWYDQVRLMTVLIATGAIVRSCQYAWGNWPYYTRRLKDLWFVLNVLMLFMIEGNLEQIFLDVGFGFRVPAGLILAVLALRAQLREEGYIKDDRKGST